MSFKEEITQLRLSIEKRVKSEQDLDLLTGFEIDRKEPLDINRLGKKELFFEMNKTLTLMGEDLAIVDKLNQIMRTIPIINLKIFNNKICKLFIFPFLIVFRSLKEVKGFFSRYLFFNQALIIQMDHLDNRMDKLHNAIKENQAMIDGEKDA